MNGQTKTKKMKAIITHNDGGRIVIEHDTATEEELRKRAEKMQRRIKNPSTLVIE